MTIEAVASLITKARARPSVTFCVVMVVKSVTARATGSGDARIAALEADVGSLKAERGHARLVLTCTVKEGTLAHKKVFEEQALAYKEATDSNNATDAKLTSSIAVVYGARVAALTIKLDSIHAAHATELADKADMYDTNIKRLGAKLFQLSSMHAALESNRAAQIAALTAGANSNETKIELLTTNLAARAAELASERARTSASALEASVDTDLEQLARELSTDRLARVDDALRCLLKAAGRELLRREATNSALEA